MADPTPLDPGGHLGAVAEAVRADLEAHLAVTKPEMSIAAILSRFLGGYASGSRYRFTSGLVVGERDPAGVPYDCLIVDADVTPSLPTPSGRQVVPADAVFGVVEGYRDLDRSTLAEAAERIAELKRIHRRPLFRGDEMINPYLGTIVAMRGLTGKELLEALARENDRRPFEEQIDLLCILDHGLVGHAEAGGDGAVSIELPLGASPRWRLTWLELGSRSLLAFVLSVWETLGARGLRRPRMHVLLRGLPSGPTASLPFAHGVDRGE